MKQYFERIKVCLIARAIREVGTDLKAFLKSSFITNFIQLLWYLPQFFSLGSQNVSPSINSTLLFLQDSLHYLYGAATAGYYLQFTIYIQDLNLIPWDSDSLMFGLTNGWGVIISCCVLLISVWWKSCPGGSWGHTLPFDLDNVQHCELIYPLMFTFASKTGAAASKQWEGNLACTQSTNSNISFYLKKKISLTLWNPPVSSGLFMLLF